MQERSTAQSQWQTMTLSEQMGNIGSEVGRASNWKKRGNEIFCNTARDRALELLDFTASDIRWHGLRKQEITRVREVLCDFWWGENTYGSTTENLEKYFMAFAVAARK